MNFFERIFSVFSRRWQAAGEGHSLPEIPNTSRYRILQYCAELFGNPADPYDSVGSPSLLVYRFWPEIHRTLQYRHGRPWLSDVDRETSNAVDDLERFLRTCTTEHFLDFLEDVFRADAFFHVQRPQEQVVREVNHLLQADALPMFVTDFVIEEVQDVRHGRPVTAYTVRQYPQVVLRTADALHAQVTEPALDLLRRPEYRAANSEYLAALEDYRKGDYGDAIAKCGSAFESVMKVICARKRWPYKESDTAATLLSAIMSRTRLEPFFKDVLLIVATARNRLSTAHGAGTTSRVANQHLADFVINATGTYILLLVKEVGEY